MTNPPKTADVAKVEQIDRIAAWHYANFGHANDSQERERWHAGYYDAEPVGHPIRAFARHRHQALSPARGEGEAASRQRMEGLFGNLERRLQRAIECSEIGSGAEKYLERAIGGLPELKAAALSEQPRPSAPEEVAGHREALEIERDSWKATAASEAARANEQQAALRVKTEYATGLYRQLHAAKFEAQESRHTIERLQAALSPAASVSAEGVERLREALGKHVVFNAYSRADPLAIRLQFANEADRLAAANAIDEAVI